MLRARRLDAADAPMSNAPQIHGHEVIEMVSCFPGGIAREELAATLVDRFGAEARFHTCSADGMDLDGLLEFLEARDKVRLADGVVFPGGSPACSH